MQMSSNDRTSVFQIEECGFESRRLFQTMRVWWNAYTLVLEASAFGIESSSLSMRTKLALIHAMRE